MADNAYWLTNVRLETGYQYENGIVTGTETGLFHVQIVDGKISEIVPADQPLETGCKWISDAPIIPRYAYTS